MRHKKIGPALAHAGTDPKNLTQKKSNNPAASIAHDPRAAVLTANNLEAALDLASTGWAVFPCWEREHDKTDRATGEISTAGPKDPRIAGGFRNATTDPDQIRKWWTRWPAALIGAPVPIGLLVLDLDPYHGGTLEALEAVTGALPATVTTWSGRNDGGRHLFYRVNPNLTNLTSTRLPAGVDLRAGGKAYTIVAPSLHPLTGQPYRWEGSEFAPLPRRALCALLPPPPPPAYVRAALKGNGSGLVRTVAEAVEGNRNAALFWSARSAAADGILDQLTPDLIGAARSVGLSELETRRTIASARRAVTA